MIKINAQSISQRNCVREGKLIAAVMSSDPDLLEDVKHYLAKTFGTIELASAPYLFDAYSSYYAEEMGTGLQKQFISFEPMIAVETLPAIKQATNALEHASAVDNKRRINIDPGYVTHAQMVLATTKPYSHRIYLGNAIFAELTYLCKGKEFYPLEWTYFDYREAFALKFFLQVRQAFLRQMRTRQQRASDGAEC